MVEILKGVAELQERQAVESGEDICLSGHVVQLIGSDVEELNDDEEDETLEMYPFGHTQRPIPV